MDSRVAIVTGGTRGIGRAIALRLAAGGFVPVLVYRSKQVQADEALLLLRAQAPRTLCIRADLTDEPQAAQMAQKVMSELGRIDILVNNAFVTTGAPHKVHELPAEKWRLALDNNLTAVFLATKACLPVMITRRYGRIVLIGSLAMRGEAGRAAYAVAKAGLVSLSKTLAQEYAQDGITANVVSPGFIEAGGFLDLSPEVRERAAKSVPMRRLGTPEEVAAAVSYLASEEAAYTTGTVIEINGGAR